MTDTPQTNNNREIRVFISSTFRDMQEERHYLMSHVFPVVRRACRDRQVEFTEIDLRWGVTQEEAEQGKVLRICLEEINRCRPYFVSLLGDRYGWTPLDTDLDHKAELLTLFPFLESSLKAGLSVTEMEILHGVLDTPDMAEHCFFYLRDKGLSQSLADKYASNDYFETKPPLKAKLETLKARLRSSGLAVRDNYTSMEVLGELIKADLLAALDKQFPKDQTPTPFKIAQNAHRSYARELCHAYSVNLRDIEALDAFLKTKTNYALLVTAESGLGKSALLAYWIDQQRLANPEQFIIEHYIGISGDVDPAAIVYRIIAEIKHRLNDGEDLPSTPEDVIRNFPLWLAKVSEQDPLLLIIDGLNQLESKECLWLPIFWQENVTAIFSVIPGDQLELFDQRDWPIHTLEALDVKRKEQLIRDWLATYCKALSTQQTRRIAQAPQTGNPLFLKTVLEELRIFGYFEHLDQHIDVLLTANNPQELFILVLERLEKNFSKAIVTQIMQALWAARRGLSETEIAGITELSRLSISTFLMTIDMHLAKRGGLLNFFHDYLRLAVKHYCFENKQEESNVHIKLAHYFNNQEISDRVAEELPWQWQQAQKWENLKDCISAIPLFSILYEKDDLALLGYWLAMGDQFNPGQCYLEALEKWEADNIVETKTLIWTLDALGYFLSKRFVQLSIAESIYHRALEISETNFGVNHLDTAMIINNCAILLSDQGHYEEAECLYYRSLAIRKQIFGADHLNTADVLNNLAELCRIIGQFEKSELLYHQALKIYEKDLGAEHLSTANCLNNLAILLKIQGNFEEAELLCRRALAISENVLGRSHPDTATILNNLANLLSNLKPTYRQAVGTEHPDITPVLNNLANELNDQRNEEAGLLYRRALAIRQNVLGAQHHRTACSLNNLVNFLRNQGEYEEAETLYRGVLSCYEKTLGTDHLDTAMIYNNLALLLHEKCSYDEAEDLYHRAINIYQRVLGEDHFDTAMSIQNLADLLSDRGSYACSERLYRRALKIYEKVLGNHINTAGCLNNLGNLLSIQGCFKDAEPLYRRALVIYEKEQGNEHPDTIMTLTNLAMSLTDQGKLNDVLP